MWGLEVYEQARVALLGRDFWSAACLCVCRCRGAQDWLFNEFSWLNATRTSPTLARQWLLQVRCIYIYVRNVFCAAVACAGLLCVGVFVRAGLCVFRTRA